MLDDLQYIHQHDPGDALGVAEKQWQQLKQAFDVALPKQPITNVVVACMGGSALPMYYLHSWPALRVPYTIVSDYTIPAFVGPTTLFIAASFSGNTEEILSALSEAESKQAIVVAITAGGELLERATNKQYPLYRIPTGTQPRMATFYFWAAMSQLLESLQLVPEGTVEELRKAGEWLGTQPASWLATVPTSQNLAKQLAQELVGKSVVVYSGPVLAPAAHKWKICINENAKQVAWWNQFPEFSHNEFIGWSSQPVDKPYAVIDLRSNLEHERVQKRFVVTEKMLSGKRPAPEVVAAQGETVLQQLLWTSMLGDFTSIYLALLNNVDPTLVDLVEKFKAALDE